jgi:hypothetical protein
MKKHYRFDKKAEVVSRDTKNTTYRQVFCGAPMRYLDGGKWRDVNIGITHVGKNYLNMTHAPYRVHIPRYANQVMGYENQKHAIMLKPLCNHVQGKVIQDGNWEIRYKNAFGDGAHLRYTIGKNNFKKEVVLTKKPPGTSDVHFDFGIDFENFANLGDYNLDDMSLDDNMDLVQDTDYKSIIGRPKVCDSNFKSALLPIKIKKVNGRYRLRKTIPRNILDNATYPLYTDAIVYYGVPETQDTWWGYESDVATWAQVRAITQAQELGIYDDFTQSILRVHAYGNGLGYFLLRRCSVIFNVSTLPTNAEVTDAYVRMFVSDVGDSDNDYFSMINPRDPSSFAPFPPPGTPNYFHINEMQGDTLNSPTKMATDIQITSTEEYGWITWTLNSNGKALIVPLTDDYVRLGIRDRAFDVLGSIPTLGTYSQVSFLSANYGGGEEPQFEIQYTTPLQYTGTGGFEMSGSAISSSSYEETGSGGCDLNGVGGMAMSGSEDTTDGFSIIYKVARVRGASMLNVPDPDFPAGNLVYSDRPFKECRSLNDDSDNLITVFLL